jgi:hypothetical protein
MFNESLTLLTSAAFIATLGTAEAQPQNLMIACQIVPCVYDSNNTIIGIINSPELLMRQLGGKWYVLFADADGLVNNTMFFYANSTCAGQPYVPRIGELPPVAWFDGSSIWTADAAHTVVTLSSWSIQGPPNPTAAGACVSYGPNYTFNQDSSLAIKIDTTSHGWHPPFSIK